MIKTVKQHQWRQLTLKAFFTFTVEILDEKFHFLCQKIVSMRNILLSTLSFRQYTFINPFHATGLFWYPLKTSENLWFSDVFRGYQKRSVVWNGLTEWFPCQNCYKNRSDKNIMLTCLNRRKHYTSGGVENRCTCGSDYVHSLINSAAR